MHHRNTLVSLLAAASAVAGSILFAIPAHATTVDLDTFELSDGTTTSSNLTVPAGTAVTTVINGQRSGSVTVTTCAFVYNSTTSVAADPLGSAPDGNGRYYPIDLTLTAGVSVSTQFPSIQLTNTTGAPVRYVISFAKPEGDCSISGRFGISVGYPDVDVTLTVLPEPTMSVAGDARIGTDMVVTPASGATLRGTDLALWACPDRSVVPTVGGYNRDCVGPFLVDRTGNSTVVHLGFSDARDADDAEAANAFWSAACDHYLVMKDEPSGGYTDFLGPFNCTPAPAPTLAETGSGTSPDLAGGALALTLLGFAALIIGRRTRSILG